MTFFYGNGASRLEPVILLSADSSNRYDGSTQDWVATAATPFVALRPFLIPAYTLRDHGWIEITMTGLLTGDAASNIALRFGLLRNSVSESNGGTYFDGTVDNIQLANTAASPASACPFVVTVKLIPIGTEDNSSSPILVKCEMHCTTTNGLQLSAPITACGTISTTAGTPATTPFDNTIDNVVTPLIRKGAAGTATWDVRSLTVIHYAPRGF